MQDHLKSIRLCKRSKNCSGLEKEDSWWWKDQPVIIVLQSLNTLKKKADTNQLHCLGGGGWQWNIISKHYLLSHHYCILQGLWAKKPKAYPKLSQATQEVASVRGLSLVKYSILTICCCSVVVRSSQFAVRSIIRDRIKAHFPKKQHLFKQQHYHAILKACSYLFYP